MTPENVATLVILFVCFFCIGAWLGTLSFRVYKDAQSRVAEMQRTIDKVCEERDNYAISFKRDREALSFYGSETNWASPEPKKRSLVAKDRGHEARKALSQ